LSHSRARGPAPAPPRRGGEPQGARRGHRRPRAARAGLPAMLAPPRAARKDATASTGRSDGRQSAACLRPAPARPPRASRRSHLVAPEALALSASGADRARATAPGRGAAGGAPGAGDRGRVRPRVRRRARAARQNALGAQRGDRGGGWRARARLEHARARERSTACRGGGGRGGGRASAPRARARGGDAACDSAPPRHNPVTQPPPHPHRPQRPTATTTAPPPRARRPPRRRPTPTARRPRRRRARRKRSIFRRTGRRPGGGGGRGGQRRTRPPPPPPSPLPPTLATLRLSSRMRAQLRARASGVRRSWLRSISATRTLGRAGEGEGAARVGGRPAPALPLHRSSPPLSPPHLFESRISCTVTSVAAPGQTARASATASIGGRRATRLERRQASSSRGRAAEPDRGARKSGRARRRRRRGTPPQLHGLPPLPRPPARDRRATLAFATGDRRPREPTRAPRRPRPAECEARPALRARAPACWRCV